jgi:protein SCO1
MVLRALKIVKMLERLSQKINHLVYCLLLAIVCIACEAPKESLPYYNNPDFTPIWLSTKDSVDKQITHSIKPFSFYNQDGKLVNNATVKGKIHVANFFFTSCPSICPKMTVEFQTLQAAFVNDPAIVLLSYSVTPWMDSIARLKEYAQNNAVISDKWHLLTGNKADIYSLARQSYFAEESIGLTKDSTEFLHTEHFILVDQNGRLRGIYNGTLALETERLIADIKLLKGGEFN